jgi:hypothetical protein
MGRGYMYNNEMRTRTHDSGEHGADGSVDGEKSKGVKEGGKNDHGAVLLITYYASCEARSAWSSWFRSGGGVGWRGVDGTARRVLLSRTQFAPGEVELKAAWAGGVGDRGERSITRPRRAPYSRSWACSGSQARRSTKSLRRLLGVVRASIRRNFCACVFLLLVRFRSS